MSTPSVQGSCSCGHVQYEASLPSLWVGHCHCENCRRAQGAGIVTYAGFPKEALRFLQGEPDLTSYFNPDTSSTRRFCRLCGSTITFEAPRWPTEIHLIVANLTSPLDKLPTGHAFADRSPAWCPITDDLPQFGGPTGTEALES